MKTVRSYFLLFVLCCGTAAQTGRTFLEEFLGPYRVARRLLMEVQLQSKQNNKSPYRKNQIQRQVPDSVPFPCDVRNARSLSKPLSVHQIKPGDIDVTAALGDSLTAGVGATAINVLEVLLEERGKSFPIGGEGNWRQYLTLPNILKMFNSNLIGYAVKTSLTIQQESQFNVAEINAISSDIPYMARELVKRMKSTKCVNINEDWKMITIFIGANNFCDACYLEDMTAALEQHRKDMIEVLRILRDNLPRTIVNFVLPPHLKIIVELKTENPACSFIRAGLCSCLFGHRSTQKQVLYEFMDKWLKLDMEIGNIDEFDTDDFTVVVQPFLLNYNFPTSAPGVADSQYLSADCFHFSQKAHARVANDLWNNIMEPVGNKSFGGNRVFEKFNCPSDKRPYIFTRRNS
ncbi:phospholipase B1, membrane-associated-like [Zophobas morio]|uniref:phospholipase B1, membrane-associated-like n=1 Tax=Zophobas morio TaxID=2755281 RepID=UPI0030832895